MGQPLTNDDLDAISISLEKITYKTSIIVFIFYILIYIYIFS